MTHYFDQHTARYLFFAPGEKVTVTVTEEGPHAMARISSPATRPPSGSSRRFVFTMPTRGGGVLPVDIDGAFSGTLSDFLESKSQLKVEFKGSKGTRYMQALRPQGGTGRWTYLATIREPNAKWYVCSTPCKDWTPTKMKPKASHCPFCKHGVIIELDF